MFSIENNNLNIDLIWRCCIAICRGERYCKAREDLARLCYVCIWRNSNDLLVSLFVSFFCEDG